MDFYERKRRAGIDLQAWVVDEDRRDFSSFCRHTLLTYGLSKKAMENMLYSAYPKFLIVNEKLTVREKEEV